MNLSVKRRLTKLAGDCCAPAILDRMFLERHPAASCVDTELRLRSKIRRTLGAGNQELKGSRPESFAAIKRQV